LREDADRDGHTIEWNFAESRWTLDPGDTNHIDDDYNGYCDDLVGFDFSDDTCGVDYGFDPQPCNYPVGCWRDHGDKTAGTAAAVTNNYISPEEAEWICLGGDQNSVAGTTWFSKIMIARMWDDWDAINAIDYARNNGAKIISMSWGWYYDNPQLQVKLDEAWNAGLLLIASAGEYTGEVPQYPASYANVIAVAATDSNDVKDSNSPYGTWVDICAPGSNKSPSWGWRRPYCYGNWGGTSTSAPFVAGVAALVWSCRPTATNAEVRAALEDHADNICGIPGNYNYCYPINKLGHGRINALEAVKVFRPIPPPPGDCNVDLVVDLGDVVYLISYIYQGGPPPDPICVGDVNDNGMVSLGDIVYLITYIYRGGPPPLDGCD
jgi:subtilisin family serine protease